MAVVSTYPCKASMLAWGHLTALSVALLRD